MSLIQPVTHTEIHGERIPSFEYYEHGLCGVGKNKIPIVNMDPYIDHSMDKELHYECLKGLAITDIKDYKIAEAGGGFPPEEVARLQGHDGWTEVLKNLDQYDVDGLHKKNIIEILESDDIYKRRNLIKYVYYALGANIPWFFVCYLKYGSFLDKTQQNDNWTECAKNFPKLVEYVKSLPFKSIGRVMFFTTYPNTGVTIHRDLPVGEHKDHVINMYFDGGSRPSFVYDEVNKKKIYIDNTAKSYTFNNRDYHGVDPEPVFRYTLRVDGTFTDELCEKLNLEDGYVYHRSYDE